MDTRINYTRYNRIHPILKRGIGDNPISDNFETKSENPIIQAKNAIINTKKRATSLTPTLETKLLAQDVNKLINEVKIKSRAQIDKANSDIKELNQYVQNKSRRKIEKLATNSIEEGKTIQEKAKSIADELNELIRIGYIYKYKDFSSPSKTVRFEWDDYRPIGLNEYDKQGHFIRHTTLKEVELRNGSHKFLPDIVDEFTIDGKKNRFAFNNIEANSILESYQENIEAVSGIEKASKQMTFDEEKNLTSYSEGLKAYDDGSEIINTFLYFKNNELQGYKERFQKLNDGTMKYSEAMFYENGKLCEFKKDYRKKAGKETINERLFYEKDELKEYNQNVIEYPSGNEQIARAFLFKNGQLKLCYDNYKDFKLGGFKYSDSIEYKNLKPVCYNKNFEKSSSGAKSVEHQINFNDGKISQYKGNMVYLSNGLESIEEILNYKLEKPFQYIQDYFKTIYGQISHSKLYEFNTRGELVKNQ